MGTTKKPIAVVIGVGPGLGAALARRFADEYSVAILARKGDYLKDLAADLRASGATVLDLTCDVSNQTRIAEAFRAIRANLGEVEVLLYNAGSGAFGSITEITPDQYEADLRVNAYGALVAAR
jgi:short-subunit dehydrogenase